MPYQILDAAPSLRERLYFPEAIRGIAILMKQFLRNLLFDRETNPAVLDRDRSLSQNATLAYPEERAPYPPGYRGVHRLVPREDGRPRCVACYMCATVCPAQCIHIEACECEDDPIEKYPEQFVIDELRCVVCGFCVEACPKDAIRMDSGEHAPPTYTREDQLWDERRLLRGPSISYKYDPWLRRGSSLPHDALETMRARARPFRTDASDEYAQTPGFSVRVLAAEAKERDEKADESFMSQRILV